MKKEKYIGETNVNKIGLKMTVMSGPKKDLTIKFEDGSIVKHKIYTNFKNGAIEHPKGNWLMQHINETNINNAGFKMSITGGTASDLTVKFEDGSIVKHKKYGSFTNGKIEHPKGNWLMQHINETTTNNAGLKMSIISGTSTDLTIKFEDGSITEHRTYEEFKNGTIGHPKGNWIMKHINETVINSAGLKMSIIGGIASDLTVKFEDECIANHKTYNSFKKGAIEHPKGNWLMQHINETNINNAGFKMSIIDANKATDITVKFEDGSIVKHKTYGEFKNGTITHPNGNWLMQHINETTTNNAGLEMSIIDANGANDITIKFEDGSITRHKTYGPFAQKQTLHPLYPVKRKSRNHTEIGCITRKNIAYKTDTCHYYCTCNICQHNDIWNWKEIHEHNALHGIPKEDLIFIEPDEIKDEKQSNRDKNPQS